MQRAEGSGVLSRVARRALACPARAVHEEGRFNAGGIEPRQYGSRRRVRPPLKDSRMNVSCALTIPDRRCGLALFSAVKNRSRQRKAVVYATLQRVAAWATVSPAISAYAWSCQRPR